MTIRSHNQYVASLPPPTDTRPDRPNPKPGGPGQPGPQPQPQPKFKPAGAVPEATDLPGAVAYWKFDEGEGDTARDAKSEAQGTPRGGKWVAGVRGKALEFDGTAAWFDFGTAAALNFADRAPFTIGCWVKPQSKYGPVFTFRGPDVRLSSTILGVWLENGKLSAWLRKDGDPGRPLELFGSTELVPDVWHHVALTRHPDGTVELFQDGVAAARKTSKEAAGALTTNSRALGWERHPRLLSGVSQLPQHKFLRGAVDEFAVYDRVLSADEVAQLAGR